jgi:hypothetical protein
MEPHERDLHARSGRSECPPHGPHLVDPVGEEAYVARCLACGLSGPERADVGEAKLAFDEATATRAG